MKWTLIIIVGVALCCLGALWMVHLHGEQQRAADARAQVDRWAEQLQSQTTKSGVFIRHPGNQLPEEDPWGTTLSVQYAQGGLMETLTVRSAGPDRVFHTQDDIMVQRSVMNFKGIGRGATDNVEEFTHNAARGLTKGAAEGIKETVQEALAEKQQRRQQKP
jgi:hypothetical protein